MSKLWVCMGKNGMPQQVDKCEFRPTVLPFGADEWIRVYRGDELSDLQVLECKITAHQEAMRPLLQEWSELKRK